MLRSNSNFEVSCIFSAILEVVGMSTLFSITLRQFYKLYLKSFLTTAIDKNTLKWVTILKNDPVATLLHYKANIFRQCLVFSILQYFNVKSLHVSTFSSIFIPWLGVKAVQFVSLIVSSIEYIKPGC